MNSQKDLVYIPNTLKQQNIPASRIRSLLRQWLNASMAWLQINIKNTGCVNADYINF